MPNNHGGFEQFAEFFSLYMVGKGYDVSVFNSHNHPYKLKTWNGVNIIHQNDPESRIGTFGQFIYDLNCIRYCRKEHFDIILQLGYTSSSIWSFLFPKKSIIITNMDGLEWKRSKYSTHVQKFLKIAEKLAVKGSDFLISDSLGIQKYIFNTYKKGSKYIAYGATIFKEPNKKKISEYDLKPYNYSMLIARLEPENNIEVILDGFHKSNSNSTFIVIGKINKFGEILKNKYQNDSRIKFLGSIYDLDILNNLRYYSRYYFHGHSVGGTNPSLLEAMASGALIIANDNIFNKSILKENARYFKNSEDVSKILDDDHVFKFKEAFSQKNYLEIESKYTWELINEEYEIFLLSKFKL